MKAYFGSIRKKGRRYYLTVRIDGKTKWIALKTESATVARRRAANFAYPPCGERAWLEHLAAMGDAAREVLSRSGGKQASWENLARQWLNCPASTAGENARAAHMRWLHLLDAVRPAGTPAPNRLSARDAAAVARYLSSLRASAPRIIRFFRKVWKELGLGDAWASVPAARTLPREYYRRLTADELQRLFRRLAVDGGEYADMAAIGYATGLRLSDVAGLERDEVAPDCSALRTVPGKTRNSKPEPILVPLAPFARPRVKALMRKAEEEGRRHLFSEEAMKRPSRRFSKIFRECGILKIGGGRAGFHSLRATFISMMDEAGVPPHVTDAVTGHAPAGMHGRYTQPSAAARMAAVSRAIPPV